MSNSLILGTRMEGKTVVQERLRADGLIETHRDFIASRGKGVAVQCGDTVARFDSMMVVKNSVEVESPSAAQFEVSLDGGVPFVPSFMPLFEDEADEVK